MAILRPRPDHYADAHPGPREVLLIIEVADTTLDLDHRVKARLYAGGGMSFADPTPVTMLGPSG